MDLPGLLQRIWKRRTEDPATTISGEDLANEAVSRRLAQRVNDLLPIISALSGHGFQHGPNTILDTESKSLGSDFCREPGDGLPYLNAGLFYLPYNEVREGNTVYEIGQYVLTIDPVEDRPELSLRVGPSAAGEIITGLDAYMETAKGLDRESTG